LRFDDTTRAVHVSERVGEVIGVGECGRGVRGVLVPFSCWVDRSKPRYKSSSDILRFGRSID